MKLEETIRRKLFRSSLVQYSYGNDCDASFIVECKAESGKPIPLCIPNAVSDFGLVYRKLTLSQSYDYQRSTPRALYNLLFGGYYTNYSLVKVSMKDKIYYYSSGVLFNEDRNPLFYFAYNLDESGKMIPLLYITPMLLRAAALPNKPMEKFFMSTIVPYLVENKVQVTSRIERFVKIEIDNQIDDVFFIPDNTLISSTSIDNINARLNDILADNADVLSSFVGNYYYGTL